MKRRRDGRLNRMSRRQKITGMVLLPVVAALVLVPWTLHGMAKEDRRHARFYNTGKTINAFLSSYCKGIAAAIEGGDPSPVAAFYSDQYSSPGRGRWTWGAEEPETGAVVMRRLKAGAADAGMPELAAENGEYLAGFRSLDKAICKIDLIEEVELEVSAVLTAKLILDGIDGEDRSFQDRHILRWHLVNEAGPSGTAGGDTGSASGVTPYVWRIARDELVEGIRVAGDRSGLVEIDAVAAGIDFERRRDPNLDMKRFASRLRFGVIQHAGGGLSAADYDGDGRPDLLLLDGERLRLYRNVGTTEEGEPRFADVTAEAGLDGIGRSHAGIFVDCYGDGGDVLSLGR